MLGFDVVQVAYHVPDIRAAAQRMVDLYGAGPFYVADRIGLSEATHRGQPCRFVHSSAYGQWGNVMMELVQQDDDGESPFRDLFTPDQSGLHHMAVMVDDLDQTYDHFDQFDIHLATHAVTTSGVEFTFLDAIHQFGHFVEVYQATPILQNFYALVRGASVDWAGDAPIREL